MQLFSNDLGVDLGSANTLIYSEGKGVVVREPSVVAMDKNTGHILQVGAAARNMLGRTPGNVVAMHPLKDGVISDHEMTVSMLKDMPKHFKTLMTSKRFDPLHYIDELVDLAQEKARVEKELKKNATELEKLNAKLNNPGFVGKAPEHIIAAERERAAKLSELVSKLEEQLKTM